MSEKENDIPQRETTIEQRLLNMQDAIDANHSAAELRFAFIEIQLGRVQDSLAPAAAILEGSSLRGGGRGRGGRGRGRGARGRGGRGRGGRGSKTGGSNDELEAVQEGRVQKRRPGRPPGSQNKTK
ncbi:hypothetical protein FB192DRAFT_1344081 [Mucor lusitanicus]|uniref:Uncharacterized protein n=2 Tax=Mucor circinelloides f. lusitanicus TaxID=29924 RepID=A0A162QB56_MUCCL|nr:hypothetical protein FB192DRAFT_1344081 [Mucor lusitanicus]OAD00450.1 hypothetical protein MUCCIDRAFT_85858 [Mucor lusitanicus CBS 277.49]